jgi:hypothetical protein
MGTIAIKVTNAVQATAPASMEIVQILLLNVKMKVAPVEVI